MTTPVKDKAVVIQSVGRVARAYPGKQAPLVVDFVDDIRYCVNAYKARKRIYRKLEMKLNLINDV